MAAEHDELREHAVALATEIVTRINRMVPYIWGKPETPVKAQALLVEVIRELQKQVKT